MALVNDGLGEINCKVVYVGPPFSGKSTNLARIRDQAPDEARGDLVEVPIEADPDRSFDFLPLDLGVVHGYRVRLHLFTIPGSSTGEPGRAGILKGADGVVFVVDSARDRFHDNFVCQHEVSRILDRCRAGLESVAFVVQYNKRDLPDAVPLPVLNARLNPTGAPSFEAVATSGRGVFATLQAISQLLLDRL
ncbi:MAG: GTP-binding protein [Chloroflexota bacterium]